MNRRFVSCQHVMQTKELLHKPWTAFCINALARIRWSTVQQCTELQNMAQNSYCVLHTCTDGKVKQITRCVENSSLVETMQAFFKLVKIWSKLQAAMLLLQITVYGDTQSTRALTSTKRDYVVNLKSPTTWIKHETVLCS